MDKKLIQHIANMGVRPPQPMVALQPPSKLKLRSFSFVCHLCGNEATANLHKEESNITTDGPLYLIDGHWAKNAPCSAGGLLIQCCGHMPGMYCAWPGERPEHKPAAVPSDAEERRIKKIYMYNPGAIDLDDSRPGEVGIDSALTGQGTVWYKFLKPIDQDTKLKPLVHYVSPAPYSFESISSMYMILNVFEDGSIRVQSEYGPYQMEFHTWEREVFVGYFLWKRSPAETSQ